MKYKGNNNWLWLCWTKSGPVPMKNSLNSVIIIDLSVVKCQHSVEIDLESYCPCYYLLQISIFVKCDWHLFSLTIWEIWVMFSLCTFQHMAKFLATRLVFYFICCRFDFHIILVYYSLPRWYPFVPCISQVFRLWSFDFNFTRGPLAYRYCHCLCVCVCLCVNFLLVRAITYHPFKLG